MHRLKLWASLVVVLCGASIASAQGIIFPGAGPVHRSMGGVSTAAAVDPIGANYWNPAVIAGLPDNQFGLGMELLYGDTHLSSTIPAGAVLGIFPPTTRTGTTRSDSGLTAAPALGLVWQSENLPNLTIGLGLGALITGTANFPGSLDNPILSPNNPPNSFGFGPIYSNAAGLVSMVNAAYQITDKLAIGLGGSVTTTSANMDPAFFAGRNDANGDGVPNFPAATHSHPFWGGGFQLGLYYHLNENWDLGFSYKSPIWQEIWRWRSEDEVGAPLDLRLKFGTPSIYSWGIAYKGIERTILAVDVRYFDYENADLFGKRVIDGGLGWESIFAIGFGAQRQITDRLTLRLGYLFNENPIPSTLTLFNTQLPGIVEHTISAGASIQLTDYMAMNIAYVHGFKNAIEGSILQLDGASVGLDVEYDSLILGLTVKFGGRRCRPAGPPCDPCETVTSLTHTPASIPLETPVETPIQ